MKTSIRGSRETIRNDTMHGYKDHGRYVGGHRRCGTTNIIICPYSGRVRYGHHKPKHDRPPKLARFYGTCGLLDRDVASRMSDSELLSETAAAFCHSAKKAGGIATDMGRHSLDLLDALARLVRGVFKLVDDIV